MRHRDRVQSVLTEFAASIGLEQLALNEEDRTCVIFDDTHEVYIDCDDDRALLTLSCRLGPPRVDDAEGLFRLLLGANAFWRELPMTFALDAQTGEVLQLAHLSAAELDLPRFQAALGGYLVAVENWSRVVAGDLGAAPAEPARPAAADEARPDTLIIRG